MDFWARKEQLQREIRAQQAAGLWTPPTEDQKAKFWARQEQLQAERLQRLQASDARAA